ncbi:MAG: hypothetical protein JXA96_04360 [Sedimentisphaerales bacterium]|nr:hypothetical protein [Sedimentisphaerales bacterium]
MRPTDDIKNLIKKMEDKTSEQMDKRIIDDVLQTLENSKTTTPIGRFIMKNPIIKFTSAAVIVLAIVGILQIGNNSSNNAYAQTVEKLRNSRTLTYTWHTDKGDYIVYYKEPYYMRREQANGGIAIEDYKIGKRLYLDTNIKQYLVMDFERKDQVKQFEEIDMLKELPNKAEKYLGVEEKDGRLLEGYLGRDKSGIFTFIFKVWLDKQTKELVSIEIESTLNPEDRRVMTDINFDIELDDSLFNTVPPADYSPYVRPEYTPEELRELNTRSRGVGGLR